MKKKIQLVPLEIIKESEAVEVVVMSPQIDHDKNEHNNESQTTTTKDVSNAHGYLSENKREEHGIPSKDKGEELPT